MPKRVSVICTCNSYDHLEHLVKLNHTNVNVDASATSLNGSSEGGWK